MAWRQGHLWECSWIPGCHEDPSAITIVLQLVDHGLELVDTLAFVRVVHSLVLSPEVSPLEAVDWTEVPFLPVRQPDVVEEFP